MTMQPIFSFKKTNNKNILEYEEIQNLIKDKVLFCGTYKADVNKIVIGVSKEISNPESLIIYNHEVMADIDIKVDDVVFDEKSIDFKPKEGKSLNLNLKTNINYIEKENTDNIIDIDMDNICINIYSKELYDIIKKEVESILLSN